MQRITDCLSSPDTISTIHRVLIDLELQVLRSFSSAVDGYHKYLQLSDGEHGKNVDSSKDKHEDGENNKENCNYDNHYSKVKKS